MQVMTSPGVNYPGAFPGMHVINSSQRCLFLHMTLDLFETCLSFLDLRSITRLCMTSRLDQAHRDAVVRRWRRSCMERWASYRVRDWGTGPGIEFTVNRQDWVLASMAREWTETQFTPGMSPASRIEAVTEAIGRRLDMPNVLEEGLRWIVQLFDEHGEAEVCHARPNEITLRKLVFLMSRRMMDRDVQHLGLKVVGILSLNEQSRKVLPGMGVVDLLINALNIHDSSQHLIENALWALVILGRPLGSSEGMRYPHQHSAAIAHVSDILSDPRVGIVNAVIQTMVRNVSNPSVLAKAFWATVNLSLMDCNKQQLINSKAIHLIILSMFRFPDERELQFRACFALINLSLNRESRTAIRNLNGIEAILGAMARFGDFPMLQRCACNVLVSLAWSSRTNRERMVKNQAAELVNRALTKFPGFRDINEIGMTFLALIAVEQ
ncbi:F-box domain-containing protein [Plasmodiophora brassicae]|uniref:F-box domain-containing protein n=1 Tax=Plasmodiophora brassicae TaxID=37360 RepID=A0A0G4IVS7_PLABS|nr:hypothetical protein PBRA_001316 [Plasmodiophora brassicae]